jgi:hypothetical protein
MQEFQTNKKDLTLGRLIDTPKRTITDGEVRVKIDRFAFTANNITYAVMGDMLRYWQFFPPNGDEAELWGIIPVWGFADVVESNNKELAVGERLFGYFPPANELVMTPSNVKQVSVMDGSAHRADLPPGYNMYRRVNNEPGYNKANDNERMLLFVLHLTSFCIHDLLESNAWFGAEQVVIISASSKTSTGLAYGLADDDKAPHLIGLTSERNLDFVNSINSYDSVLSYANLDKIDPSKPTVIIDMSANTDVLSRLHMHLGDNMRYTCNVGLTHWDEPRQVNGINQERSHQFFAPSHIQQRMQDWGPEEFGKRSIGYVMNSTAKSRTWLKINELAGVEALADVYQDVCDGKVAADEGLVVVL